MRISRLGALVFVVALVSACGASTTEVVEGAEETTSITEPSPPATEPVPLGGRFSFADFAEDPDFLADPAELEEMQIIARQRWAAADLQTYVLTVGYRPLEPSSARQIVVVDGEVTSDTGPRTPDYPASVEELFLLVDKTIEANREKPSEGCGPFFIDVGYDREYGIPIAYSYDSPCRDPEPREAQITEGPLQPTGD